MSFHISHSNLFVWRHNSHPRIYFLIKIYNNIIFIITKFTQKINSFYTDFFGFFAVKKDHIDLTFSRIQTLIFENQHQFFFVDIGEQMAFYHRLFRAAGNSVAVDDLIVEMGGNMQKRFFRHSLSGDNSFHPAGWSPSGDFTISKAFASK